MAMSKLLEKAGEIVRKLLLEARQCKLAFCSAESFGKTVVYSNWGNKQVI